MIESVKLSQIVPSKTNPRQNFDAEKLRKLTESIQEHGVLQPILVRPHLGDPLLSIIVAGERRFRAASAAGLEEIPVILRKMSDEEALEFQMIENLERDDLHPLEEARGYQQLIQKVKGYDVAKIATRIGRSVKYVYDRVKLLGLTKELQAGFLAGKFEAGQAILLARLKPEDQKRVADPDAGGLFQVEHTLFDPYDRNGDEQPVKAHSVREVQGWIDEHVKFQAHRDADPMLFPEAAEAVASGDKVVAITHNHFVRPEARDGKRVLSCRSWRRADGQHKSKPCDQAVTGMIVVGPGRGESFAVCTSRKKCRTHWGPEMRESKARAAGKGKKSRLQDSYEKDRERRELEQQHREVEAERWEKALPAIRKAVAEKVLMASARAQGLLGEIIFQDVKPQGWGVKVPTELPRGRTAEDLVRYAAFMVLADEMQEWNALESFPKRARALGIDAKKIVNLAAPKPKVQTPGKPVAGKKKVRRKK